MYDEANACGAQVNGTVPATTAPLPGEVGTTAGLDLVSEPVADHGSPIRPLSRAWTRQ